MKKSYLIMLILLVAGNLAIAQVGVGTATPNAQLDVVSSNQSSPTNTDGILIPKVNVFPATNPTAAQQSMLVYLTTATIFSGNPKAVGFYYWNNPTSDWIALSSSLNGDHDWYEVGTTTPPDAITDDMFHSGNAAIGKNTIANAKLDVETTNTDSGIKNLQNNSNNNTLYGFNNTISGTGSGIHYGNYTELSGTGGGTQYGYYANITNSAANTQYGSYNALSGNGFGGHTGNYNLLSGTSGGVQTGTYNEITNDAGSRHNGSVSVLGGIGDGEQYGFTSTITNSGTAFHYGNANTLSGSGTGSHYGNWNLLNGAGNGSQYGVFNNITNTGSGTQWGTYNNIDNTGTGVKYGDYNAISPTSGGTHYGVYSTVLKPGAANFAGYFLGNVGIGTTTLNTYTLPPSRGTNGQTLRTDGAGNVSWANNSDYAWSTTGNAGTNGGNTTTAGTNFIGTTDAQNLDFRTANNYVGRFSSLGEFFVGTLNTVVPGDLMNSVGNATFPWAINGYTAQAGGGVYGQITGGTSLYGGVQGETLSTNAQATGVRGLDTGNSSGSAFATPRSGVSGNTVIVGGTGTYKFGVYGNGGQQIRTGGVMGNDFNNRGALGYFSSGGVDYSFYGFGVATGAGVTTGRSSNNPLERNTNIGIGVYGGVMGGWIRGLKYGFHTKGETYSLYVDGSGYTNKPLAYLISTDGESKTASYMSTSLKPEVTVNGKVSLQNGKVFVPFKSNFSQIISNIDDVIITASPQGKSNGVYIDQISKAGFWIYENNDGTSNVKISWIAITKIKGEENPTVPNDLLANDFDEKMDKVMFNENDTANTAQSLWWDGSKIRWDKPTVNRANIQTEDLSRPGASGEIKDTRSSSQSNK